MVGRHSWLSIVGFETLIANGRNSHVDIWFVYLNSLELLVLHIHGVNFIDDISRFQRLFHYSSKVFLGKISLRLSLIAIDSQRRLSNTGVLRVVLVDGS